MIIDIDAGSRVVCPVDMSRGMMELQTRAVMTVELPDTGEDADAGAVAIGAPAE